MKYIESAQNHHLKQLGKLLSQAKERRQSRQCVLEGVHLLQAYLARGGEPVQVFVPQKRLDDDEVRALLRQVPPECCTAVADGLLKKISSLTAADDVMTLIDLPSAPRVPNDGDCVVLDGVQDPGNIGAVLRSAAAAGVQRVVLGVGCADVYAPKVLRAAMGAHFLLAISERVDLLAWRKAYGGKVLATALRAANNFSLYETDLRGTTAWIFGNEGSGVSEALLDCADATVRIPMMGATESLNIAMAATVCLFEQMRQRLQAA